MLMLAGGLLGQRGQLGHQAVFLLHRVQQLLAGKRVPRGCDDGGLFVVRAQQRHGGVQLLLGHILRAAQQDGAGVLDLVVVEFAKILHINPAFCRIGHGDKACKLHIGIQLLHGADHVGKLAHAGRLDYDAVGRVLFQYFGHRRAEIAHQAAADAAGIHLGDLDAGFLQKAAVNANLAEFVLDQHQLFPLVGRGDQFFDQRRFARAQKAGDNGDFCHGIVPFLVHRSVLVKFIIFAKIEFAEVRLAAFFSKAPGTCLCGMVLHVSPGSPDRPNFENRPGRRSSVGR